MGKIEFSTIAFFCGLIMGILIGALTVNRAKMPDKPPQKAYTPPQKKEFKVELKAYTPDGKEVDLEKYRVKE